MPPELGLIVTIIVRAQADFHWLQFWWKISCEIRFIKNYVLVTANVAASEEDQGHLWWLHLICKDFDELQHFSCAEKLDISS